MKNFFCSILTFSILTLTSQSTAQLSKESCKEILENIDIKSFNKLKVLTKSPTESNSHGTFNFDVDSYSFTYNDTFLKVKDTTGLTLFIPYVNIKLIKTAPKSGEENSNVTLYLIE